VTGYLLMCLQREFESMLSE